MNCKSNCEIKHCFSNQGVYTCVCCERNCCIYHMITKENMCSECLLLPKSCTCSSKLNPMFLCPSCGRRVCKDCVNRGAYACCWCS